MSGLEYNKRIYTVGQINKYIKQLIESDFLLKNICVKGEVSNCRYQSSGHIYFSLKDETGVISAVIFASKAAALKIKLEDGKQVTVTGSLGVYEAGGRYQLYVTKAEEEGEGDLFRRFEELKKRLEESGMFAPEYKKRIPEYAMKIGVATSAAGAVIQDIKTVALRRNPYCRIYLYPVTVQGENAKQSIVKGLKTLDSMELDVIIVGRGGGSIEDLWAFNEEDVARAIFDCSTPVISAVGHETDFTIADFVADLRAATPSEAAERAVFEYEDFERKLGNYAGDLTDRMERKLSSNKDRLKNIKRDLEKFSLAYKLETYKKLLPEKLKQLNMYIEKSSDRTKDKLKDCRKCLDDGINGSLREKKEKLSGASAKLEGISPLKRLSSGYAYVSCADGKTLRSIEQIEINDKLVLNIADGEVEASVTGKRRNNG